MPTVTKKVSKVTTKPNYSYFNWFTSAIMILLHIGAVAALFMFSWKALIISAVLYWVCIGFGIGMGYHRLHTHRSYKVPVALEYYGSDWRATPAEREARKLPPVNSEAMGAR